MTFKLAECSIRVTALLEYLDLALNALSLVSLHNYLALLRFFSTAACSFYEFVYTSPIVRHGLNCIELMRNVNDDTTELNHTTQL